MCCFVCRVSISALQGLRLKLNMWLVGTVPNPDESSVSLASRRGLVVIHHHFSELSLGYATTLVNLYGGLICNIEANTTV